MISSVLAKLIDAPDQVARTLEEISNYPGMEIGQLFDNRLLPVTIEADDSETMELATRWLQSHAGVENVDVVFVHFEEQTGQVPETR